MRFLVTGVKGQLGHDLMEELALRGHVGVGVDVEEMDITDPQAVDRVMGEAQADGVFHCAAYTEVDAAEDNVELCNRVNAGGTENIAKACRKLGLPMMYISTDYVFDGEGERPWQPEDERHPLNVYGQAKYLGELAVQKYLEKYYIVRIAWVFGLNGNNFVKAILNKAKTVPRLTVVDDQVGSPTYTRDLAVLLADMMETDRYGIYHATNEGICTWYEFAKEIIAQAGLAAEVAPVSSEEYPAKAKRPHNSRMDKGKLEEAGFHRLPPWQDALRRYLEAAGSGDTIQ